ncbi:MAG: 23S rRNA (adenine(2503)-C(2))-methyltransferase RlmN [Ruminococcaceae bacterium]|nr:23S rRNA (adenine(2503)-C(2))-methyltransferase RlmN [Oscillospiraceae bacterium]
MSENKIDILSLFPEEMESLLENEPKYRIKQLFGWLHKGAVYDEMTNLPKKMREELTEKTYIALPDILKKYVSKIDGTVKYLFKLYDGQCIESVVMKYKHGNTICISSQAGCKMGCKFCASTQNGWVRNLTPSEMLGQVLVAQNDTGIRISNIVLMGIGEPLDNYSNVMKFLRLVSRDDGLNIGLRHISLSTCGVVDKIYALADEDLPVTLSVSLHHSNDTDRSALMPINKKWNIDELLTACKVFFDKTGRRISFEYAVISGVNDNDVQANALADLLNKKLPSIPFHVNLIPVNPVEGTGFTSGIKTVMQFQATLEKRRVNATIRRKLGSDIDASCGQLRRREMNL